MEVQSEEARKAWAVRVRSGGTRSERCARMRALKATGLGWEDVAVILKREHMALPAAYLRWVWFGRKT